MIDEWCVTVPKYATCLRDLVICGLLKAVSFCSLCGSLFCLVDSRIEVNLFSTLHVSVSNALSYHWSLVSPVPVGKSLTVVALVALVHVDD